MSWKPEGELKSFTFGEAVVIENPGEGESGVWAFHKGLPLGGVRLVRDINQYFPQRFVSRKRVQRHQYSEFQKLPVEVLKRGDSRPGDDFS